MPEPFLIKTVGELMEVTAKMLILRYHPIKSFAYA